VLTVSVVVGDRFQPRTPSASELARHCGIH